ncbi:3-ketoacyl-CoA thiolase, mitochondrial [Araneus ventricosus]|uniref:3-ketoacyl-CoA thiolase, mitochondrial n=1 Tax=Araneus ventricosus TaxID=182803 RepID=A0A4Y2ALA6_ARAVE|nr:3-ketoacyl-CoA thiolase, mitochondrial [Araneus ventricosus]
MNRYLKRPNQALADEEKQKKTKNNQRFRKEYSEKWPWLIPGKEGYARCSSHQTTLVKGFLISFDAEFRKFQLKWENCIAFGADNTNTMAGCNKGVDPTIMGIGPVDAIRKLCDNTGVKLSDVDLVDVNEAFASQFLAVQKELNLDPTKTNINGGAIALGHPVGASGARIVANLTYELRARKARYAIGSACIGGGQGIAVMLENIS